jgi:hypothetical protein
VSRGVDRQVDPVVHHRRERSRLTLWSSTGSVSLSREAALATPRWPQRIPATGYFGVMDGPRSCRRRDQSPGFDLRRWGARPRETALPEASALTFGQPLSSSLRLSQQLLRNNGSWARSTAGEVSSPVSGLERALLWECSLVDIGAAPPAFSVSDKRSSCDARIQGPCEPFGNSGGPDDRGRSQLAIERGTGPKPRPSLARSLGPMARCSVWT